jgi:hypothetical protein
MKHSGREGIVGGFKAFQGFNVAALAALAILATAPAWAQSEGLAEIQKQLDARYPAAKATADGTDLVSAGAVLVLQKDHLVMCKVDQPMATANFYKNGAINQGGLGGLIKAMNTLSRLGGQAGAPPADTREFVAGEKFFVTHISTASDGVILTFMSDPIKDQRYKSTLKVLFPKGGSPTPDSAVALVEEVVKVDAPAETAAAAPSNASGAAAAPAAQTKTISIGQTRDEVIALFGVPSKVVHLGAKEIDYFADMKVTFVQNKVANVE